MYNLTNNPSGALGQAGQANASTRPQGLFSNAPSPFSSAERKSPAFMSTQQPFRPGTHTSMQNPNPYQGGDLRQSPMWPQLQQLFSSLFGGQGNMTGETPPVQSQGDPIQSLMQAPQKAMSGISQAANGVASIFGPRGVRAIPGAMQQGLSGLFGNNSQGQRSTGGGFLSRFMQGGK